MLKFDGQSYEVVNKDNSEFNELFLGAWDEIGITPEYLLSSDYLLMKNKYGKAIATVEIAKYDKGFEHEDIENVYKFSQFQNEEVQLIYMDKITIAKSERSKLENILLVMTSIFTHVMTIKNSKKQVIVAFLYPYLYNHLTKILNVKIEKLSEPINGEIPILIDVEKNKELLEDKKWLKINMQSIGI